MDKRVSRDTLDKLSRAAERIHRKDEAFKRASNLDFVIYIVTVVIVVLAVRMFLFEPILVSGDSMYDTLIDGERMFVEKVSYWAHPPRRGDIIICYYPHHTKSCVKRVIGEAGDKVSIIDGAVYVNGARLDESAYWDGYILGDMGEYTVPLGTVFVMGDNRNESGDSRRSDVGPIPYRRICGRVTSVIWPIGSIRSM